jgi:hypothetical protein
MVRFCGLLLLLALGIGQAVAAPDDCRTADDHTAIIGVIEQMLAALARSDEQEFRRNTTADFTAYDIGRRFSGTGLFELVQQVRAEGNHFSWSVTNPEVLVDCRMAFVSYENQGWVESAGVRKSRRWLESVQLLFTGDRWQVRFLHSTPVAES